jgi:PAS domain S-box-containing protein
MHKILYVDDESVLLDVGKMYLEASHEFTVDTSGSATEVMKSGDLGQYDAIVSDYQMPGMDGIAFLKEVRSRSIDIPFILFTGRGREEVVIEAINNGADFYVQKGGDPKSQFVELMHKIRIAIQHRLGKEALLESEAKFRAIFSSQQNGILIIDPSDFRIVDVNPYLSNLLGLPREQIAGKVCHTCVCPAERGKCPIMDPGQRVDNAERVLVAADGRKIPILKTVVRITLGGKEYLIENIQDITERKRVEERIVESQVFNQEVIDGAKQGIVVYDRHLQITLWNRFMEDLTGIPASDVLGKNAIDLFPFHKETGVAQLMDEALVGRTGTSDDFHFIIAQTGKSGWTKGVYSPHYDAHDKIVGVIGIVQDISERKLAEDEMAAAMEELKSTEESLHLHVRDLMRSEASLRESEKKFRSLVENSLEAILILDFTGTVLFANTAAALAIEADDGTSLAGRNVMEFVAPESRNEVIKDFMQVAQGHDAYLAKYSAISSSGKKICLECVGKALSYEGKPAVLTSLRDITRSEQVLASLKENEGKYRTLADSLPDYVFIHRNGKILYVNQAVVEVNGMPPEEIFRHPIIDFIAPESKALVVEKMRARMQGEPSCTYEAAILVKNGEMRRGLVRSILFSFEGEPASLVVISDITERKQAEVLLQQERALSNAIIDMNPYGIQIFDAQGHHVRANPAFLTMFKAVPPADYCFFDDPVPKKNLGISKASLAAGRTHVNAEVWYNPHWLYPEYPDNLACFRSVAFPIINAEGRMECFVVMFEDVTERKRAEDALRESEASYRGLFNTIQQAIYLLDRDGKFVDVNDGAVAMYGYTREEFVGRTPEFLSAPGKNDLPAVVEKITRAFSGEPQKFEFWGLRKNGEIFPKDVFLYNGTYFGEDIVIAIGADISERRRAEEELRASEQKFSALFVSNPVSLTIVSAADGRFVDANDAFLQNTGYTRDEVVGKTSDELGIFADPDEYAEFARLLTTRREVACMALHTRIKTGEIRICRFFSRIILMGSRPHIISTVEDVTDQKALESAFQTILTSMVRTTGLESLDRIAESVGDWLGADCVMIGEIVPDRKHVKVLSMLLDGKKIANYSYTLEGTPCDNTAEKGFCLYPDNAAVLFPKSRDLRELSIRGYAGTPLRNSEGQVIGVLCILTRKPLTLPANGREILDIIAVKATAEIGRRQTEEHLSRINDSLLHLGTDPLENIRNLTALCGDLLAADCVLYNKLQGGMLCVVGQWHCPPDLQVRDAPEGHICYDVIKKEGDGPLVVCNLSETHYARSDPNVAAYGLKTYIGHPVRYGGVTHGSLCAVYTRNFKPTPEDQKIIGILSTAIAQEEERGDAQQALRESEEKYRLIADNTADNIWIFDMDFRLKYISPSVTRMKGFTVEEALAQPLERMLTPASLESVMKQFQDEMVRKAAGSADPGRTVAFESEEYCKDGSIILVENTTVLLRDEKGHPAGILGISRDITGRRRAEGALRESEENYRQLFDAESDAILLIDNASGQILQANNSAAIMYGYSRKDLLNLKNTDLSAEPENTEQVTKETPVFQDTVVTIPLRWHRKKDKTRFPVEITGRFFQHQGRPVHIAAIRDISARILSENALRQANRQLSLMTSITRHDIRNQLLALKAYLGLSKETLGDTAKTLEYVLKEERVAQSIEHQINFTRDYEDLGVSPPVWQSVENCIDRAVSGLDLEGITLSVSGLHHAEIFADPLLQKVFFNLVENSLRHGGEAMTKISFSSYVSAAGLTILCEDDGAGIPNDEKEVIFERGYGKNTGYGLFLIREILAVTGITIKETGDSAAGVRFEIAVQTPGYRYAGST